MIKEFMVTCYPNFVEEGGGVICYAHYSSDTGSVDLLVMIIKFVGTIRTEPCVKMNSVIKNTVNDNAI